MTFPVIEWPPLRTYLGNPGSLRWSKKVETESRFPQSASFSRANRRLLFLGLASLRYADFLYMLPAKARNAGLLRNTSRPAAITLSTWSGDNRNRVGMASSTAAR